MIRLRIPITPSVKNLLVVVSVALFLLHVSISG
jgi:hypothetical protein